MRPLGASGPDIGRWLSPSAAQGSCVLVSEAGCRHIACGSRTTILGCSCGSFVTCVILGAASGARFTALLCAMWAINHSIAGVSHGRESLPPLGWQVISTDAGRWLYPYRFCGWVWRRLVAVKNRPMACARRHSRDMWREIGRERTSRGNARFKVVGFIAWPRANVWPVKETSRRPWLFRRRFRPGRQRLARSCI